MQDTWTTEELFELFSTSGDFEKIYHGGWSIVVAMLVQEMHKKKCLFDNIFHWINYIDSLD